MTDIVPSGNALVLPSGVTIGPGRPTSQLNASGQVVQGLQFTLSFGGGTQLPVFIPNTMLTNLGAVQSYVDMQIASVRAITGE